MLKEVTASEGQVVMFIDEIHTVVGAGANSGSMDASNLLKPMLARGELRCIGATTLNEYKQVELNRRRYCVGVSRAMKLASTWHVQRVSKVAINSVEYTWYSVTYHLLVVLTFVAVQHMEKDKALERRFQQVYVKQPNVEDTVSIARY